MPMFEAGKQFISLIDLDLAEMAGYPRQSLNQHTEAGGQPCNVAFHQCSNLSLTASALPNEFNHPVRNDQNSLAQHAVL